MGIPSLPLYLTGPASLLPQVRSDLEAQAAGATLPGLEDWVDDLLEGSDLLHPTWLCPSKGMRIALAGTFDKRPQLHFLDLTLPWHRLSGKSRDFWQRGSLWADRRAEPQVATQTKWTDRWTG